MCKSMFNRACVGQQALEILNNPQLPNTECPKHGYNAAALGLETLNIGTCLGFRNWDLGFELVLL